MSVPVTVEFVTRVEPLVVMNQNQIGGLVLVIAINLNKQIGGYVQADLYEAQGLVERLYAGEILAPFEFFS